MIEKVITGGQSGCDLAAWDAAVLCGIPTGGAMTRGFLTEEGPRPEYAARYGAVELSEASYPPRTRANVQAADLTLVMGDVTSRGSLLAFRTAAELYVPAIGWDPNAKDWGVAVEFDYTASRQRKFERFRVYRDLVDVAECIRCLGPRVINIGGNRESRSPGIYLWANDMLIQLFRMLNGG